MHSNLLRAMVQHVLLGSQVVESPVAAPWKIVWHLHDTLGCTRNRAICTTAQIVFITAPCAAPGHSCVPAADPLTYHLQQCCSPQG